MPARPGSDEEAIALELSLGRWLADATIEYEGNQMLERRAGCCKCDSKLFMETGIEGLRDCLGAYRRMPHRPQGWFAPYPTGCSGGCMGALILHFDDGATFRLVPEHFGLEVWSEEDGTRVLAVSLGHPERLGWTAPPLSPDGGSAETPTGVAVDRD